MLHTYKLHRGKRYKIAHNRKVLFAIVDSNQTYWASLVLRKIREFPHRFQWLTLNWKKKKTNTLEAECNGHGASSIQWYKNCRNKKMNDLSQMQCDRYSCDELFTFILMNYCNDSNLCCIVLQLSDCIPFLDFPTNKKSRWECDLQKSNGREWICWDRLNALNIQSTNVRACATRTS